MSLIFMWTDIFLFYHMLTWKVFNFLCQFEHNATVFGDQNMKYFPQEFRCSKKILKYFFNIMVKAITTINSLYVYLLDCANYECPGEERVCLLESERCNTVEDCQDGSDELNCGKLNKLNENAHIFFRLFNALFPRTVWSSLGNVQKLMVSK